MASFQVTAGGPPEVYHNLITDGELNPKIKKALQKRNLCVSDVEISIFTSVSKILSDLYGPHAIISIFVNEGEVELRYSFYHYQCPVLYITYKNFKNLTDGLYLNRLDELFTQLYPEFGLPPASALTLEQTHQILVTYAEIMKKDFDRYGFTEVEAQKFMKVRTAVSTFDLDEKQKLSLEQALEYFARLIILERGNEFTFQNWVGFLTKFPSLEDLELLINTNSPKEWLDILAERS